MTNEELRRAMTRVGDAKIARRAELAAAPATPAAPADRGGARFVAGDRVFDWQSGSEGEVRSVLGTVPSGSPPIAVNLDRGTTVFREARDLVARPTPPAGRS